MLHSRHAASAILKERKVVVCPAFESMTKLSPENIAGLDEQVQNGLAEAFHSSHFPQGHGPTQFEKFWEKSLNFPTTSSSDDMKDYFWEESYEIRHDEMFEPYIVMASADVPLYDERFQGYGLNKISHLASVAALKDWEYLTLPGVFLVAPAHKRSISWGKIYGNPQSDENKRNQLALKHLYNDFSKNLIDGKSPVISRNTFLQKQRLLTRMG